MLFVGIVNKDEARKPLVATKDTVSTHDVSWEECGLTARIQNLRSIEAISDYPISVVIHSWYLNFKPYPGMSSLFTMEIRISWVWEWRELQTASGVDLRIQHLIDSCIEMYLELHFGSNRSPTLLYTGCSIGWYDDCKQSGWERDWLSWQNADASCVSYTVGTAKSRVESWKGKHTLLGC